jgi:NitT/TauT family transport system ATP-binding protein
LAIVEVQNISVVYTNQTRSVEALSNISFRAEEGEFWAIIGPSGCGKTTLLFLLCGLVKPTYGSIFIKGEELNGQRLDTALILQDYGLFPWKTTFENAALGLKIRRVAKGLISEKVSKILKDLGLWEFKEYFPAQLSGGMRQRVAIARSLTLEPDLLLMDEPFSSLDALTREELQNAMLNIWRKGKMTVFLVTHSIEEAVFLGQKVLVLSPRPGKIIEVVVNPGMGSLGYRNQPEFQKLCAKLRSMLKVRGIRGEILNAKS